MPAMLVRPKGNNPNRVGSGGVEVPLLPSGLRSAWASSVRLRMDGSDRVDGGRRGAPFDLMAR
ncbi:hypothetical protein GCM10022214_13270 [Actinomadura miaoliensis]|uniref:DUF397 domain-containing protein n=1 Tax=Actinomadura miaoliensis TaxID=430685 RepID=A0ABP7V822_9ACTN